ncbi:MAG: hypothetical protein KI792_09910 [Alphaproteobacteria bacterium]|nr:hypothetical protein [Alphaproteobacteria bacterium SS10]
MATFVVTTLADENDTEVAGSPFNGAGLSLREAIALANANPDADTIEFDSSLNGTITLAAAGSAGELVINQDVTIDGDGRITLDGNDNSRIISIRVDDGDSEDSDVSLSGLTFQRGNGDGSFTFFGDPTGGAVFAWGPTTDVSIQDSDFHSNNAESGGAIYVFYGADISIDGSLVHDNSAASVAGAIGAWDHSSISVSNSNIYHNSADLEVGALLVRFASSLYISNSSVSYNHAPNSAAIYLTGTDNVVHVSGSNIIGNAAYNVGGILVGGGSLTVINSVVAGNISGDNSYSSIYGGPDIGLPAYPWSGSTLDVSHSFIGTPLVLPDGIPFNDSGGNIIGSPNVTVADLLGPLQDNGGPVPTHAPVPGSLLIDAGDNSLVPSTVTTDATGALRISGGTVDIGAVEFQQTQPSTPTEPLPEGSEVIAIVNLPGQVEPVMAGTGQDTVQGSIFGDLAYGNQGNDILTGDLGMDTLFGGLGDDALYGGGDADVLAGNRGNDTLTGGTGADLFILAPTGVDVITDYLQIEGDVIRGVGFGPTSTVTALDGGIQIENGLGGAVILLGVTSIDQVTFG